MNELMLVFGLLILCFLAALSAVLIKKATAKQKAKQKEKVNVESRNLVKKFSGEKGKIAFKKKAHAFNLIKEILGLLSNFQFILGIVLYFLSAFIYLILLKGTELGFMYSLTALNYVFVAVLSRFMLNEKISKYKVISISLIVLGAILIFIS